MARQTSLVLRDPSEPDTGQPRSWSAVGAWHLLPQWQEVLRARRHGQEPHDSLTSWWHCAVWTEVEFFHLLPFPFLLIELACISDQYSCNSAPNSAMHSVCKQLGSTSEILCSHTWVYIPLFLMYFNEPMLAAIFHWDRWSAILFYLFSGLSAVFVPSNI